MKHLPLLILLAGCLTYKPKYEKIWREEALLELSPENVEMLIQDWKMLRDFYDCPNYESLRLSIRECIDNKPNRSKCWAAITFRDYSYQCE